MERAAERQREGEVKISPERGEREGERAGERGGSVKLRGCGKLKGVWEEVKCRRTGDEEKQQQLHTRGLALPNPTQAKVRRTGKGKRDGVLVRMTGAIMVTTMFVQKDLEKATGNRDPCPGPAEKQLSCHPRIKKH